MNNWPKTVLSLSQDFPPINTVVDGVPVIARALDDGLDKLLAEDAAEGLTKFNKRFVEELLVDCVNRVATCQILREKAQEVENRAVEAAVNFRTQTALLDSAALIATSLAQIRDHQGMNAIGSKTNANGVDFIGDKKVWNRVGEEEEKVRSAQRLAISTFLEKARTPGNGSNYVERFQFLKQLFEINMTELYARALECAIGLKAIYSIDLPVPKVSAIGYLNEIAAWCQRASNELDRLLAQSYSGSLTFALAAADDVPKAFELMGLTAFKGGLTGGTINFSITEGHFTETHIRNPLLRSIRLQVRSAVDDARTRFWSGYIELPNTDLTAGDERFPCVLSTSSTDTGEETVFGVHNISPIGDWRLHLPARSITGEVSATDIVNVYLHIRFSYQRETH